MMRITQRWQFVALLPRQTLTRVGSLPSVGFELLLRVGASFANSTSARLGSCQMMPRDRAFGSSPV
jgi:hypothetical protein